MTLQTWDKLASQYQDKFMDLDLYDDTYDVFISLLEKRNSSVFEIACGPGNITRYLLRKRPDLHIEAIDTAPNMIKLAKENNPSAGFKVMDCREIDTITSKYDGIICGFCMPYLSKEECIKLIKDSSFLLHSGGVLYFSTIEDDPASSDYETSSDGQHSMYVYYHSADYLLKALQENNFELLELKRKGYSKADGTSSTHLIIIAKKK